LDGKQLGLSPMGIPNVAPGPHTLRLDRLDDSPASYRFALDAGEVRRFDTPLARLPARIPPPLAAPGARSVLGTRGGPAARIARQQIAYRSGHGPS
jgi:hypothetical protein